MTFPLQHRKQGFLLLEMILALAVFSMSATGFVVALHRMAKVAGYAQQELRITRVLDSALDEAISVPTLEVGDTTHELGKTGIQIQTKIELIEDLQNEDGVNLAEMYRIQVNARWYDNGTWKDRSVETWRYGPMYQP